MKNTIKSLKGKFLFLSILIIPLFLTGCGIWGNFTTYFNRYYNASRLFDETEQEIIKQRKVLFTLQETKPSGNVAQNLTKVIEKCSQLLQFDSKSSYVDDALLITGKSFYYQQEYQKALRKFTELISTSQNSELALEAQLWTAKTQLRLKNYEQANTMLEQVRAKAQEEHDEGILTATYIEQVSYLVTVEKYNEAIIAAQKLVEVSENDEISAAAVFEQGILYLKIEQPENAAKAFADVQNYSPSFETEYLSKIQYGKVQRKLGKAESSLDIFKNIESEAKYNQFLDSTKLQIGLTYMDLKRYDDAVQQLVFIDTTFRQSPNAGVAQYYLGEIMETNLGDYDSAGYYYTKAGSSTAPAEFVQKAGRKVQTFTKYNNLKSTINQFERQLVYLEKPEEFVKDSANYIRELVLQDSLNREREKEKQGDIEEYQAARNSRSERQDQIPSANLRQNQRNAKTAPIRPSISADSIRIALAKNEYELGSLFFTELNVPDSAQYYYSHILNAYSGTPYVPRALYALGTYYQTKNDTVKADSLFNIIYKDFPGESIVNAAAEKLGKPTINLKYDAAEELYVAAEKKMNDGNYEEAITGFKEVYEKYPKSQFAPKALYASGWVLENKLKLLDSAAVVYDSVISKYPTTQYAGNVRAEVSIYKDEQRKQKAIEDSARAKLNPPVKQEPVSDSLKINNNAAPETAQGNAKLPGKNNTNSDNPGNTGVDYNAINAVPDSVLNKNTQNNNVQSSKDAVKSNSSKPDTLKNSRNRER